MIFVDRRIGSIDILPLLRIDAMEVELDYGDLSFSGNGPEGDVSIGIERKRISDLLGSIESGRLSGHQLPGLLSVYDVTYLFVEGITKVDRFDDELLISSNGGTSFRLASHGKRRWHMEDIQHYLTTLETMTGIHSRFTSSPRTTARHVEYLYHWWQKDWSKHTSHLALHKGMNFRQADKKMIVTTVLDKPSLVRKIAAELPGVGITRSLPVDKRFKSVRDMYEASEKDWQGIEGFGKVTSKMAWEALHGKGGKI